MQTLNYGTYYNLNYLAELAGGDESFVSELTRTFVMQTPDLVKNLKVSISENNHSKTNYLAHKLKSSCEILGMELASSICLKIELAAFQNRDLTQLAEDMEILAHQLTVSTYELNVAAA